MQNNISLSPKIIYRLLAFFILALGLTFCLQLSTANASYAADCTADSKAPCLSTAVDLAVHGTSGPGGTFTNPRPGGGTAAPRPIPPKCMNVVTITGLKNYCAPSSVVSSKWFTGYGSVPWASCPAKTINGYTVKSAGYVEVSVQRLVSFSPTGTPRYSGPSLSITCVYPPPPVQQQTNIRCIVGYNAYFDRNANSYLGYGARVKTVNATVSSAGAILANPSSCKRSVAASMNYNPPTNRNAWGQYTASSTIRAVTCSFASTTFDGATTNLAKCGGEYSVPGRTSALTIWCNGFAPGHLNKSWSADDCYGTGRYSCAIPQPATYNGRTGLVQGIRDGNNSLLKWGTPTPTGGVRAAGNWESLTTLNGGSTPYDSSRGQNDRLKQLFYSDNVKFGSWQAGSNLNQNLAFYAAGNSGSPFSMTRLYRYDAEFLTGSAILGSYDIVSGVVTSTPTSVWVADTDVQCGPQASPRIEVIRAIGDAVR